MADPTFTTPPAQPVRGDTADTFKTKANVFVGYFSTLVTELTALVTWVNGIVTQVTADKDTTTNNVTVSTQNKDTATAQAGIATTKAGEASASATSAGSAATASGNSADAALLSEQAAAASVASVDPNLTLHTVGSGLPNESYNKTAVDTALGGKVAPTDFASSTVGGTVKMRLSGTTLYIRNDGVNA